MVLSRKAVTADEDKLAAKYFYKKSPLIAEIGTQKQVVQAPVMMGQME
jgi:hypothetical protein